MTGLSDSHRATRLIGGGLAALALAILLAVALLVLEVVRDFRSLSTARSDNTHWALSQAEVELLELRAAMVAAAAPDADAAALDDMVVEFDIFYSRMATLATGQLYAELREIPAFGLSVARIRAQLDAMVPLIDGPRDELIAALPDLLAQTDALRERLRDVATTGLQFFAQWSDDSRVSVANTLLRLAALTVAMLLVLLFAIARSRRSSLQTERRGRQLADAYARLNTILETSLDAVIVSDVDGRILNFNPAAELMFGHRYEDVFGKSLGEIIVPDHLRAAHEAGMERMRTTGRMAVVGHGRVRLEAKRATGEVFPVELALQKARAAGDDVFIGFLRDISQRVAAEQELMDARDKALAGEQAKAEFLAMMTHEIRTPLNGLLGNLALLKKTPLDATQAHQVRNMDISGDLLMHHVDAVLDVARFEAGASDSPEEVVELGGLLQDIVDSQIGAAEAQGNRMTWRWTSEPLGWVRLDVARLRQILLNLVGNAIKFTENGRIVIEAEEIDPPEGTDSDACVEFRVIDTGIGIAEADQARVFDDFHRGQDSTQRAGAIAGTGLGLGIARRFATALGGEIGLESTPGEGSVFWLRLPVSRAEAPTHGHAAPGEPCEEADHPLVGKEILLVEDNEINLDLARQMLAAQGHVVTEARNGQEAVDLAGTRRFDLILMDVRMPVMDGLQATGLIRASDGPNAGSPIIAVSANVLPEARDRFLAAGMTGFLPKPLNPRSLRQAVETFASAATEARDPAPEAAALTDPLAALKARYTAEMRDFFATHERSPLSMEALGDAAHKLAGSAAAFGHKALRNALLVVETAADRKDAEAAEQAMAAARATWQAESPPDPDA